MLYIDVGISHIVAIYAILRCRYILPCFSVCDTYESSVLSLLSSLLVSGENSPFYQSLIESNIGSGYAPTTGYVCM